MISQEVKELLKVISHDELIEFVRENSERDEKFRSHFLAFFGHLSQDQTKAFYQKQIHAILKTAAGRDGWIGWSDMKYVVTAIEPFLENADKHFASNNFENVLFIGTALLEEITEALEYADDSNGDLGYFIDSALIFLSKLTRQFLSTKLEDEMFEYCISVFKQNIFKGWEWHMSMLRLASELINTESKAIVVLDCLDSINSRYEQEYAENLKLELLKKFRDPKEVEEFINAHISNFSIRTREIEIAFDNKNHERAIRLSKDGITCDERSKPGLEYHWYDWLLKIALAQNDSVRIIEYARFQLINSFSSRNQDYYQILKENVASENWHPFLEELIREITPNNGWTYTELIRKIYIKEEWWNRLFLMLKQNLSMENIQQDEKYLAKDYSSELIEFYSKKITRYVEKYVGRNHYQTACKYLRRMKKLGGSDKVNELLELFRKKYPRRPALMDELNRL